MYGDMRTKEIETYYPPSRKAWRTWLKKNQVAKQSIWLIYYKKQSGVPSLTWSEAVDEALCFGWIDSTARAIDEEKFMQFFCKRKPGSVWSKINKNKVDQLVKEGLMTAAGFESIETAKQNGNWNILDEVEELVIPNDLQKEFEKWPGSEPYFLSIPKSIRKAILQWLVLAKRVETREKRIIEIATLAAQKLKPKQFG